MSTDSTMLRPAVRYAVGSTLLMALTLGIGWNMAYITPVLALSFFAPGSSMPSFKQGIAFIGIIAATTVLGFLFTKFFLDYILLFIPLLGLVLLTIFYTDRLGAKAKVFMLISLLLMPLISMQSNAIAFAFMQTFILGAAITIVLVWVIFSLFPDKVESGKPPTPAPAAASAPSEETRFQYALETLMVVFPVVLVFFFFQWMGGLIILIFITLLSMNPNFNIKAGKAMIIGNLLGGIFAIAVYELLVMVPLFPMLILLVLATGLFFASRLFSGLATAPLFGMGFSTFLLVIGQTTSGTDDAGGKVWMRVVMIMIAVIYVVAALRIQEAYKNKKKLRAAKKLSKPELA